MNDEVIDQIIRLAPPMAGVSRDLISAWIEMAELFVCKDRFGDDYSKALALYTLHLMTLDGMVRQENETIGSYTQRVSSFSLSGEFSKTYAYTNNSGGGLSATPFGSLYRMLLRKKGGGFGLISAARGGCCR